MALFSFARPIVSQAEAMASHGDSIETILSELRKLSLEDFGQLLISMPNEGYPHLSKVLPRMASEEIQQQWTGYTGMALFAQTAAFARQLESVFIRYTGRRLQDTTILDIGVGYGRNLRSMLYFTDPDKLWGVDPWDTSLQLSIDAGIPGHLVRSDPIPDSYPVGGTKFDLIFAFSVFTHLSEKAVTASLKAARKSIKPDGIFVCTVRPVEYWSLTDQYFSAEEAQQVKRDHATKLFGFKPHSWSDGSYGDASIDPMFFYREGWKFAGYDTTVTDEYQVALVLKPV